MAKTNSGNTKTQEIPVAADAQIVIVKTGGKK
jgi:hypothetical protein